MKRFLVVSLLAVALFGLLRLSCGQNQAPIAYQVATISSLQSGGYDGQVTFEELKAHGDTGLGTVDGLNGEMVAVDGRFFQVKADGKAYKIEDAVKTPFAVVTFFAGDRKSPLEDVKNFQALKKALDKLAEAQDKVYAFKIKGKFRLLKIRSVAKQKQPYSPLETALQNQVVFQLKDSVGTLVGFRFPRSMAGVNVPDYHFHYLTQDCARGGHVLDCDIETAEAGVLLVSEIHLRP